MFIVTPAEFLFNAEPLTAIQVLFLGSDPIPKSAGLRAITPIRVPFAQIRAKQAASRHGHAHRAMNENFRLDARPDNDVPYLF